MTQQQSKFNDVITRLLAAKLKSFNDKKLDVVTCVEIYQKIFDTLTEVFQNAEAPVTNEAANYLAQQYYDCVLINETQELNPNIFTQRASVSNIATKELALLAVMLNGSDLVLPIVAEIKKRS